MWHCGTEYNIGDGVYLAPDELYPQSLYGQGAKHWIGLIKGFDEEEKVRFGWGSRFTGMPM